MIMKDEPFSMRPVRPTISLGHEGDMRVTPYASIPAPAAPERASAVAPYSTPLRFDWRAPKPDGAKSP
jgi:hypothetical protein